MIGSMARLAFVLAWALLPSLAHSTPRWQKLPLPPALPRPADRGSVDVDGARIAGERVEVWGWAHAPQWPGAAVAVEARLDGRTVAVGSADQHRPDLAAAGIGDGRHAFSIRFDARLLEEAERLTIAGVGQLDCLAGGERRLDEPLPRDA